MQFRDLGKQYLHLEDDINERIQNVCKSANFIMGKEVAELEEQLADYVGVTHCIACANGTDAIMLALKAWGVGAKDAVFVPDFTFFSSGECPANEGAICVFVDVDINTFNMDPVKLEEAIQKIELEGRYNAKAVIAVDLFGQPANYNTIRKICEKYNLLLLEDGAQGFGGAIGNKKACSFGDISTTSFFPAKPLGCFGDGGAVFTDNEEWAKLIRSYAVHGKAENDKYNNIRLGCNSRLDTIQAAILQVKLKAFSEYELERVNQIAQLYTSKILKKGLGEKISVPVVEKGYTSSWAQYTIKLHDESKRDQVQACLKEMGIPTMVYYKKPMHLQGAFEGTESASADCEVTNDLCKCVLSLPIHPYMEESEVDEVVQALELVL